MISGRHFSMRIPGSQRCRSYSKPAPCLPRKERLAWAGSSPYVGRHSIQPSKSITPSPILRKVTLSVPATSIRSHQNRSLVDIPVRDVPGAYQVAQPCGALDHSRCSNQSAEIFNESSNHIESAPAFCHYIHCWSFELTQSLNSTQNNLPLRANSLLEWFDFRRLILPWNISLVRESKIVFKTFSSS